MENPLTEQEMTVLNALLNGCQDAQDVADELFVSKRTVQTHLQNARRKTDTHTTTALLSLAFRSGWLSQPPNGE